MAGHKCDVKEPADSAGKFSHILDVGWTHDACTACRHIQRGGGPSRRPAGWRCHSGHGTRGR